MAPTLSRRTMLQLTTAAAFASRAFAQQGQTIPKGAQLYEDLLRMWCDGLLRYQLGSSQGPALAGALICPACALVHGRCGDAVYPLMRMAHTSGDAKYLQAAVAVYDWTERQVSRPDGSWINDVVLSNWQGITVFHTIAVAEALHHHGALLDEKTRARWKDRVARAAKFLDGFLNIETGNINYPITASYCLALCGEMLGEAKYTEHARQLAHQAMEYITPNGLIAGEGHPLDGRTPKGCRPVDLGYNVEESLPALTLYSLLTKDDEVLQRTIAAARAHMEFMLPDGGWDNSWGSRNYKWTYWGSRTSDGCQTAYALLAAHDGRFAEVARRNTELMRACSHNGLLYGGPDYAEHGEDPCIHHTFTHAKALATVLDNKAAVVPVAGVELPRDRPYNVKSFPEIATHLASVGPWRATVTAYDWEYVEHVQNGGSTKSGGGHATGGALSMLYHQTLGPVLAASMTKYQMIEISNQQQPKSGQQECLTPRIEMGPGGDPYTSLSDNAAKLTFTERNGAAEFLAEGRMMTAFHQAPAEEVRYELRYRIAADVVEITAKASAAAQLIVPIVARQSEEMHEATVGKQQVITLVRRKGSLKAHAENAKCGERTFNVVPGLSALPVIVALPADVPVTLRIEAS